MIFQNEKIAVPIQCKLKHSPTYQLVHTACNHFHLGGQETSVHALHVHAHSIHHKNSCKTVIILVVQNTQPSKTLIIRPSICPSVCPLPRCYSHAIARRVAMQQPSLQYNSAAIGYGCRTVNWLTTANGCIHTADTTQLDFVVGKSVQTSSSLKQSYIE